MKFLTFSFKTDTQPFVGILSKDEKGVFILRHPITNERLTDFFDVIEEWQLYENASLNEESDSIHSSDFINIDDIIFTAPLIGRDILAVGKNYVGHAKEFNKSGYDSSDKNDIPTHPVIFTKRASSMIGHKAQIYPHPNVTQTLDYEGELGLIIGKGGRSITKQDAMNHVWGYTIINDITARERQRDHKQFFIGKSLDTFCPIGPFLVPSCDIDGNNLEIKTIVNGELRQHSNTSLLIFDIPTLISTISLGITLQPGDIIATGTPSGVGFGFNPPKFLQEHDKVEVYIEGIGTLENMIASKNSIPPEIQPVRARARSEINSDPDHVQLKSGKFYHIEKKGNSQGPIALFIHGLGGNLHFFDTIIALTEMEKSHNVILFDWEGHGLTPLSNDKPLSIEGLMQDICCLLDYLKISKSSPITLFGHSMGGLIANTFVALSQYNIESLILIGPIQALGTPGKGAMKDRVEIIQRKGMSGIVNTICQAGLSEQSKLQNPLSFAFVRQSIMSTNHLGYVQACKALASAKDPNYDSIKARTLIISGSEDKTAPPINIEKLSKAIKQAKVYQIESVGHWHAIENPSAVSQAIISFLL